MKTINELINPVEMCAMFKLISINIRMIFKTNKHDTLLNYNFDGLYCIVINNELNYYERFTFLLGNYYLHLISLDNSFLIKCVLDDVIEIKFRNVMFSRI